MEKYEIKSDFGNESVQIGRFSNKIIDKHKEKYGKKGGFNIINNVNNIFSKLLMQLKDSSVNNNSLLVGKVQSGKTSNLELITSLAFDNDYKLLIIYGGYDNSLLKQTTDRFRGIFDASNEPDYNPSYPAIFSTAEDTSLDLSPEIFNELIKIKPVILVSMKRPNAMRKINALLAQLNTCDFKSFIIDDEGDQASLNTAKDKYKDASATYKEIVEMKNLLNEPLYLSVTATPQANIYLDDFSRLKPDSIHLIYPGNGYMGADVYHLGSDNHLIEVMEPKDDEILPDSLKDALKYFIVGTAIKNKIETDFASKYSDMIIHTVREVAIHKGIYSCVSSYLNDFSDAFKGDGDKSPFINEFRIVYDKYFEDDIKNDFPFNILEKEIIDVSKKVKVILKNSEGKKTQSNDKLNRYKIYIGGDLLQRGLTFDNLITTYFTRWAKSGGNMDTNLQRARWFGYRSKYIKLCKIFTTSEIAMEFSNLAEMEMNIWDQFEEVEAGSLDIKNVVLECDNTKQQPTSSNKAKFRKLEFHQRWRKQKHIVYNELDIKNNNELIENFFNRHKWEDTKKGSRIEKKTALYSECDALEIRKLLNEISGIFCEKDESIYKEDLLKLFDNQKIYVLRMHDELEFIKRTMHNGTTVVKALQEGRDNITEEKSKFKGDSEVLINSNSINIQIYRVLPRYKNLLEYEEFPNKLQYMFAIFIPGSKTYFVKG